MKVTVRFACGYLWLQVFTSACVQTTKNTRFVIYDLHVLQSQELQWSVMEERNVADEYMPFVFNYSWKMNKVVQVFLFLALWHKWCERFNVFTTLYVQHSLNIKVTVLLSLGSVRDKCSRNLTQVYMVFLKHGLISMTCHLGQKPENQ